MAITVSCEACGTKASAPESTAGKRGQCRKCGAAVQVPHPPNARRLGDEGSAATARRTCQRCGDVVSSRATRCGVCGEVLLHTPPMPSTTPTSARTQTAPSPVEDKGVSGTHVALAFFGSVLGLIIVGIGVSGLREEPLPATLMTLVGLLVLALCALGVVWKRLSRPSRRYLSLAGKILGMTGMIGGLGGLSILGIYLHLTDRTEHTPAQSLGLSFVEFDSKFGAGAGGGILDLPNVEAANRTTSQTKTMQDGYKGKRANWQGIVLDVRGNEVLVGHRLATKSNEVALVLAEQDRSKAETVQKGDLIEYSGVVNNFGSPYPYTLIEGTITSQRYLGQEERTKFLGDTEMAVSREMMKK